MGIPLDTLIRGAKMPVKIIRGKARDLGWIEIHYFYDGKYYGHTVDGRMVKIFAKDTDFSLWDNLIDGEKYSAFHKAYDSYPSQDNEGFSPDRIGFKAGFFAAWDLLKGDNK